MSNILIHNMIGGKINKISRVCNLICIEIDLFDNQPLYLHIQSFFRVLQNNRLILSSEDIYRCGSNCLPEHFVWDEPGTSAFDDSLCNCLLDIVSSKIIRVDKTNCGDLFLFLANDITMQVLVDTTQSEEKYRIFNDDEYVVLES